MNSNHLMATAAHDLLSEHVLQPLYRGYRALRPAYRTNFIAYRRGLTFRRTAEVWADDTRRDWVLRRLRETVRHAYAHTSFYRERLDACGFDPALPFTFADYAALPVLERADIAIAGETLIAGDIGRSRLQRDSTGGSSGAPTVVWRGPLERGWNESGTEYFMRRVGLPPGISSGLLWGHHLDPVDSDHWRDRLRSALENVRWFECLRLSPDVLEAHHRRFEAWRPQCIIAYGSALAALAEHLCGQGIEPNYPGRAMVTGAEKLLPDQRAVIEEVFRRPVHERYGSRDVGLLGFQLDPGSTLDFSLDWANLLIEPETDDPVAPILVTKLHADGMPMLRYRIGDLGRFPEASRPGEPAFALHEVLGREVDRIWLPDGRWFNGLAFPHLLKDFSVKEFQIVQDADFSVRVRIVPAAGALGSDLDRALRVVQVNLPGLPVALELVDRIERTKANKWRPVISAATPMAGARDR